MGNNPAVRRAGELKGPFLEATDEAHNTTLTIGYNYEGALVITISGVRGGRRVIIDKNQVGTFLHSLAALG